MKIIRQDTNGVKPLLQTGELGYDNYPAGGDVGRVYVGTGTENLQLAKRSDISNYAYSKDEIDLIITGDINNSYYTKPEVDAKAIAMAIALS